MRLITIPISHYCERARWALDYAGVDYREELHLQVFHRRAVRKAGGRYTTPVLVTGDGSLTDSADIVALADRLAQPARKLYPVGDARAEVEGFEREIAGDFGVETRRRAYTDYFPHKKTLLRYNAADAPRMQRAVLRATYSLARRMMTRAMDLTAEAVDRGRAVIDSTMDGVAERIADGRPYLFGDRFTAADLTFAALLAPLVLPPQYGVPLPPPSELPDDLRGRVAAMRAHPAGAFALALYARDRGISRPAAA